MRKVIMFLLLFTVASAQEPTFAQWVDTFEDGDFTSHPTWSGDGEKFRVRDSRLQLQAPAVQGVGYLSTASGSINGAEWVFTVKMGFNPSSVNFTKVYLVSNHSNLLGEVDGYFVKIGGSTDEVSLFRQTGTSETKIIDGLDDRVDLSSVTLAVKVKRSTTGHWELSSDVGLSGTYSLEGTAVDSTFLSSAFFGILCHYTSSRSELFFFDDFSVSGSGFEDNIPPKLISLEVLGKRSISLSFSEALDPATVKTLGNYTGNNGIGNPISAMFGQGNNKSIHLVFADAFPNDVENTLNLSGLKDLSGNLMVETEKTFSITETSTPGFNDLVITEIYADVTFDENGPPDFNLGNKEFIEIHNRTAQVIDMEGCSLSDATGKATFQGLKLQPEDYVIVSSDVTDLQLLGKAHDLPGFPSLNNKGEALTLRNASGMTIFSIHYSDSWYKDIEKEEGGWTLEMIDSNRPCGDMDNWSASEDKAGGTPGMENSVKADRPDLTAPAISGVAVHGGDSITIIFTEKMDSLSLVLADYTFHPNVSISDKTVSTPDFQQISIKLSSKLPPSTVYHIQVSGAEDCSGNAVAKDNGYSFASPEKGEVGDLLLNEILFNPRIGGVDFVELYNHSPKYIDLAHWFLANIEDSQIANLKKISEAPLVISPRSYFAFTTDVNRLKGDYPFSKDDYLIEVSHLPSYDDHQGTVLLLDSSRAVHDRLDYENTFHNPLLNETEGVSLERVRFDAPTNEAANWKSAATQVGFATPGYKNSQARDKTALSGTVTVSPEVFVPDNSGTDDFIMVAYQFDHPGFIGKVTVYDALGREVKRLAEGAVLATKGFYVWDGTSEVGRKARTGYYIVLFEIFDADGNHEVFKRKVVLGSRF